jgi:hypothetical protein
MPCLVSLTGKGSDFQSLSWDTWATKSQMENEKRISAALQPPTKIQLLILLIFLIICTVRQRSSSPELWRGRGREMFKLYTVVTEPAVAFLLVKNS